MYFESDINSERPGIADRRSLDCLTIVSELIHLWGYDILVGQNEHLVVAISMISI